VSAAHDHQGFHLLDAAGLVVGYSLASLLIRAYWPGSEVPAVGEILVTIVVYLWLGLAMSGPVVLLKRRASTPTAEGVTGPNNHRNDGLDSPRTWAELAWIFLGFYWIVLTLLAVRVRTNGTRPLDSALLGVLPVVAVLAVRLFGPRQLRPRPDTAPFWTHRAGVALLVTWPFAWIGLIILAKSFW
jgi:hypothetical protein